MPSISDETLQSFAYLTDKFCWLLTVVKLWGTRERRSPSLHDDSYLQHKQQKKMCVICMI